MSGPASVVPYPCAKTARGNAVVTSSMSFCVRGADPVFTNSTVERSRRLIAVIHPEVTPTTMANATTMGNIRVAAITRGTTR